MLHCSKKNIWQEVFNNAWFVVPEKMWGNFMEGTDWQRYNGIPPS